MTSPRASKPSLFDLQRAVDDAGGNRAKAARNLGIDRHKFYRLLNEQPVVTSTSPSQPPVSIFRNGAQELKEHKLAASAERSTTQTVETVRKVAFVGPATAELLGSIRRKLSAHFDREINESDVAGKILDKFTLTFAEEAMKDKEWTE